MFDVLFLNQFSISTFSQLVLSFLITLFFLLVKKQHSRGWYRTLFFILLTFYFLFSFLVTSIYAGWVIYLIAFQHIFQMFASTLIIQYTYRYPNNYFVSESRWVLAVSLFLVLILSVYAIINIYSDHVFTTTDYQLFNGITFLGYVWAILVSLRQSNHVNQSEKASSPDIEKQIKENRLTELVVLTIILLFGGLPSLLSLLFYFSFITGTINLYVSNASHLAFLFFFILGYFKLSPEPSSISKKMVAISLVTVMFILSTVGSATMTTFANRFQSNRVINDFQSLTFKRNEDGSYTANRIPLVWSNDMGKPIQIGDADFKPLTLPFQFPFYHTDYKELLINSNGILTFDQPIETYNPLYFLTPIPKIAPLFKDLNPEAGGTVYLNESDSLITITWDRVPDFNTVTSNSIQVYLYADGQIIFSYRGLSDPLPGYIGISSGQNRLTSFEGIQFSQSLPYVALPGAPIFEDYYNGLRLFMHEGTSVFIRMILIAALIVIFVFPVFFRFTVVYPVKKLLNGVKNAEAGDLKTRIVPTEDDEIGYLTESFNRMIDAIAKAKEEEIRLLQLQKEEELLEAELNRKSAELEFARSLQLSMLPQHLKTIKNVDIAGKMRPATEVGGDYYDIIPISESRYCIVNGDATGHGVAAGLIVGMVKMALVNTIRFYNSEDLSIIKFFNNLNKALIESVDNRGVGMGLTLVIFDFDQMKAEICSTGMPFPFFYDSSEDKVNILEMTGPPLGLLNADLELQSQTLDLRPGDCLVLVSDGFPERENIDEVMWFEDNRFDQETSLIMKAYNQFPEQLLDHLFLSCDTFSGGTDQTDDMTAVVLTIKD